MPLRCILTYLPEPFRLLGASLLMSPVCPCKTRVLRQQENTNAWQLTNCVAVWCDVKRFRCEALHAMRVCFGNAAASPHCSEHMQAAYAPLYKADAGAEARTIESPFSQSLTINSPENKGQSAGKKPANMRKSITLEVIEPLQAHGPLCKQAAS